MVPLGLPAYQVTKRKLFFYSLAVLLLVLFFVDGPGYHAPRSIKAIWNLGHIGFFAILVTLIHWQSRIFATRHWLLRFLMVVVLCGALGTFIELIQYGVGRDVDLHDVFRDILGGVLGFVFLPINKTIANSFLYSLQIAALFLLAIELFPVGFALYDESLAREQFPVLADFETTSELDRWQGGASFEIVDQPTVSGQKSLRIDLGTEQYSGIRLKFFPGNWQDYQTLKFNIYNPDKTPLPIVCRIHDLQHTRGEQLYEDRFNRRFILVPGWNEVAIVIQDIIQSPATRQLSIQDIDAIGLFVVRQPQPRSIYLDYMRLE